MPMHERSLPFLVVVLVAVLLGLARVSAGQPPPTAEKHPERDEAGESLAHPDHARRSPGSSAIVSAAQPA
jgi:hypothetical protein